jgi:dTDP-4-dehydrorhamnose reductase
VRFLVLGGNGMLGTDVAAELERRGHGVVALGIDEFDITDPMAHAALATGELGKFDWCINCAAFTAVDLAETERDAALSINGLGPGYLSKACSMNGCRLIHISTDFVFDGGKTEPYTEEDETHPLGVYGSSKREGEIGALGGSVDAIVVRTSWLFGPHGKSFPLTIIRAWEAGKPLKVVSDQIGCPTYTGDLAVSLAEIAERGIPGGIYHLTGPDAMSWHAFASLAIEAYARHRGLDGAIEIEPIASEDWPTPAKRPAYSGLSNAKAAREGIPPMRPIRIALDEFVARIQL